MNCLNCNKTLQNSKNKYCNNNCQKEYEYKIYINDWKKGLNNGMRGKYQVSNHIKRYLFEKFDNKCCKCGWGEKNNYTNIIPLEIEHIDGNYKNNKDCHSLTSTYKGANKGNGRKDRKVYSLYENS